MLWRIHHKTDATASFAKSARRVGAAFAPDKVIEPPLRFGLSFFLQAFFDLDTERSHNEGWVSIPWSSIKLYSQHYEMDQEQTDRFINIMLALDVAHISKLDEMRREREEQDKRKVKK